MIYEHSFQYSPSQYHFCIYDVVMPSSSGAGICHTYCIDIAHRTNVCLDAYNSILLNNVCVVCCRFNVYVANNVVLLFLYTSPPVGHNQRHNIVSTHKTFLFSFLRTVRPNGLCVISSVLLIGLDGWLLRLLTCSWGTSNLCLWAS